jgi:hypothetical protein
VVSCIVEEDSTPLVASADANILSLHIGVRVKLGVQRMMKCHSK